MRMASEARRHEFSLALAPLEGANMRWLGDIPAGGAYLEPYLPESVRVIALDPVASFGHQAASGGQTSVVRGAVDRVPLGDGALDAIVSVAGLHHMPDKRPFYEEAVRLVRPGGRVVICDVEAGSPVDRFLNGFVDTHNPDGHDGVFLDRISACQVAEAGLEVCEAAYHAYPWCCHSRQEMVAFCKRLFGLDAPADKINDGLQEILGVQQGLEGCELNWGLQRIVARVPAE